MNGTVAWITARGLFGRRRFLLLLPLPVLMVGLAVLGRAAGIDPGHWGDIVVLGLGFAVVLPVTCLIIGTGVLGAEIDDGTIVHILTKPLPRRDIVLTKLVVATGISAVTVALPMYVVGVLAHTMRFGLGLAAAAAIGAVAYSAFFLLLSLLSRRPVLVGLVYILVWENLLSNLVSGSRVLSIQQYAIALADRFAPTAILTGKVSVTVAVVLTAIIVVGATMLAIDRLRSFSVAGETS